MVKANKMPPRCWNTKAADKKRELRKTCFCIIVHLFREFVKGAAAMLGFLAVAALCEAAGRFTDDRILGRIARHLAAAVAAGKTDRWEAFRDVIEG